MKKLIAVFALFALCLCLLAGCGEEAAENTTQPGATTMSWEDKVAQDQERLVVDNTALSIVLADLGVAQENVNVHTITSEENREVEVFLEANGVMYQYKVDMENCVVLSKNVCE